VATKSTQSEIAFKSTDSCIPPKKPLLEMKQAKCWNGRIGLMEKRWKAGLFCL